MYTAHYLRELLRVIGFGVSKKTVKMSVRFSCHVAKYKVDTWKSKHNYILYIFFN